MRFEQASNVPMKTQRSDAFAHASNNMTPTLSHTDKHTALQIATDTDLQSDSQNTQATTTMLPVSLAERNQLVQRERDQDVLKFELHILYSVFKSKPMPETKRKHTDYHYMVTDVAIFLKFLTAKSSVVVL